MIWGNELNEVIQPRVPWEEMIRGVFGLTSCTVHISRVSGDPRDLGLTYSTTKQTFELMATAVIGLPRER